MRRNQLYPVIALVALLLLPLFVLPAAASVAGAHSLQIPPGARFNGLGQAGVALADDATAPWWNPAGMAFMQGRTLGLMHSQLVPDLADDIYFEYASWVHNMPDWGTYGVSLIYLSYGESVKTTDSPEAEGTFSSFEVSPAISYGVRLDSNTGIGLTLKYVRVDLAPVDAVPDFDRDGAGSSVAVDLGFLRKFGTRASLGAVLSNFGPNISFINDEQSDPLPRHIKLGASYLAYASDYGHVLVTGDYNQMLVDGGPTVYNGGSEFQYMDIMAMRIGWMHDDDGDITAPTFGGGFHVGLGGSEFYLDYASVPQASGLDRVHRFSFEMLF